MAYHMKLDQAISLGPDTLTLVAFGMIKYQGTGKESLGGRSFLESVHERISRAQPFG